MTRYRTEEEALKHYDSKKYRTPDGYTSDIVCATIVPGETPEGGRAVGKPVLKVMLIKRAAADAEGNPNIEGGKWAIPGGFGSDKETACETAVRELSEETGVTGTHVKHFGVFDKPGRDRRGWIISNAHYAIVPSDYLEKRQAADDAEECGLFTLEEAAALDLAFDHAEILSAAVDTIKREMMQTTIAKYFLPAEFTLSELRDVLLTVLADDPMISIKSTFWDKAPKLSFIELVTDEEGRAKTTRREGVTKRVRLFRFNDAQPAASIYR